MYADWRFLVRILLFLNPVPVHHPDIFLAVDNHMVYHADPQLFVKLCDGGMRISLSFTSTYKNGLKQIKNNQITIWQLAYLSVNKPSTRYRSAFLRFKQKIMFFLAKLQKSKIPSFKDTLLFCNFRSLLFFFHFFN